MKQTIKKDLALGALIGSCVGMTGYLYNKDVNEGKTDNILYQSISPVITTIRERYSHRLINHLGDNRNEYDPRTQDKIQTQLHGCVISGSDFNKLFYKPVKYINMEHKHYGMTYDHDGEYTDILPFYPYKECSPGGLYFYAEHNYHGWNIPGMNIAHVTIPDDAHVYVEYDKFKTNKFILSNVKEVPIVTTRHDISFVSGE